MIIPGVDIKFRSGRSAEAPTGDTGTVLLPLIGYDYGPEKEFISISAGAPDANMAKLGRSVYGDNTLLLVREALKVAAEVDVYIPKQGAKATGAIGAATATAKYGGSFGNKFKVAVAANPAGGFDVTVYVETDVVETFTGLASVGDLKAAGSVWLDFDGTDDTALEENAGVTLANGTDGVATNDDFVEFLDASELEFWDTMALPIDANTSEGAALLEMTLSKIRDMRENASKYRALVLAGHKADYRGVINVADGVVLEDGTELTPAQVTAWVAGADASAGPVKTNTYRVYEGAKRIKSPKSKAQREEAVKNGEFVFTYRDDGAVVTQYDINSLTTIKLPMNDNTWAKNRVRRTMDAVGNTIVANFPPGKFENSAKGWDAMEGVGAEILAYFEGIGAIRDVDYSKDFKVDRTRTKDDVTYFNVWIRPIDSAEKLYFTITTL